MKGRNLFTAAAALTFLCVPFASAQSRLAQLVVQTGHSSSVRSVAFTPDGRVLASLGLDSTIKIWDVASGKEVRTIGDSEAFGSISLSPDGKTVATNSFKTRSVKLYSVATGELLRTFPEADPLLVWVVQFSPDGETIATLGYHNKIKIWNVRDGTEKQTYYPRGQPDLGSLAALEYSSDGRYFAAPERDGVRVWEPGKDQSFAFQVSERIFALAFSPDGKLLAVGEQNGTIKIFNIEERLLMSNISSAHSGGVTSLAFSPDGKTLVSGGRDQAVRMWGIDDPARSSALTGHSDAVFAIAFNRTGDLLATGSGDNSIKLWNPATRSEVRTLKGISSLIFSPKFSRDGRWLAIARADKTIQLWNAESGTELRTFRGHTGLVWTAVFSPNGKYLASGSADRTIRIWDVESGRLLREVHGHIADVRRLAFSPDGVMLASGDSKGWVSLLNLRTGERRDMPQAADSHEINALTFSPDGSILATGGWQALKLWDARTLTLLREVGPEYSMVSAIAFSRDGKVVAMNGNKQFDVIPADSQYVEEGSKIRLMSVDTLAEMGAHSLDDQVYRREFEKQFPLGFDAFYNESVSESISARIVEGSRIQLRSRASGSEIASLVTTDDARWTIVAPDGRFDTNNSLDDIRGLHWVDPAEPFTPIPLEIFMRQYYETGLFSRLVRCDRGNNCASEFRRLPSVLDVNRIQPKVGQPRISPPHPDGSVDVSIDVENVNHAGGSSGIFDLRLFVDRQLVASSATRPDVERYISEASPLTDDTESWRRAHDVTARLALTAGKGTFVFRNVRLPRDDRTRVEISAYAFNADRVKSETVRTMLDLGSHSVVRGKTVLVTIGVNASESAKYDLDFAANDARQMDAVLAARIFPVDRVIRVNLVSDRNAKGKLTENRATKKIIKGVFDSLSGRRDDVDRETLAAIGEIPRIESEDRLILTYSGHGYTRNGVFYMLPYDIGEMTGLITESVLPRLISSDELSLWMRDIVAREILLIVDACHSAASVQGSNFKPGPMGSRGLGQLAYDKGMRVLAAAQSNNVALELRSLQHGLLSYALLENGVVRGLADVDDPKDGLLSANEWLAYAIKGVPELYKTVMSGKAKIAIGGETVDLAKLNEKERAEMFCEGANCKSRASVQQPVLFDFARAARPGPLMKLRAIPAATRR